MRRGVAAFGGLVAGVLPASAMAQTVGGSVASFGVGEWLSLMLRLGLVVGAIWAAVYAMRWYTRRAAGARGGAARTLDIVETRSLGPNRALHLVRIGGRAVLIGVTPERINALMEVDDPGVLDGPGLSAGGPSRPAVAFSTLLAGFGAGGDASHSGQARASEGAPRAAFPSAFGRRRRQTARAARRPRRPLAERVLALFGFTPAAPAAPVAGRMRPSGPATPAAATAPLRAPAWASPPPAFSVAPDAAQTLRARSGYRAAQQSSHAGLADAPGRDERIAEAQRAIAAAWRQAG